MDPSKAVIFDMDGLLIDTESHAKIAWQRAAVQMGFTIDDDTMLGLVGCHISECLDILTQKTGRDLHDSEFMERVDNIYFSGFIRRGVDLMVGVQAVLDELVVNRVRRAVATSSQRHIAPRKLRLAGIEHYFDLIVTGCEVEKSKPAPDIFLLTAERLGVAPSDCLVLEDSYNGIRAAHAAGMHPLMIPDQLPATEEMTKLTHGIFSNLDEASPYIFDWLSSK